jgi:phosphate/sulfate permease
VILRNADEIRVEPDAWRVVVGSVVFGLLGIAIAAYIIGTAIDSRRTEAIGFSVLVLAVIGALIAHQVLRPNALVIRPDAVGLTRVRKMRWVSRESFERVKVVFNMFGPDVLLMSASGKTVRSLVVTQLLMKELRQAFTEAGYSVEGWTGPKRG